MHLVEGLTLEHISKAYGVHHTTRSLDSAIDRVLEEARRELSAMLPVSTATSTRSPASS
jgi:hypothetical protein